MRAKRLGILALFGVVCLNVAVAIALAVPPADGYELSLYAAYPVYFWALVVGAIFLGSVVIVGSAGTPRNRSWVFGLSTVFVANALLLLMPYVRGYQMYGRADAMSHLGFVREIATSGGIEGNIYPPMHMLVLALAEVTSLDPMTIATLIPAVFSGVYFGAMFYLLVVLFDSRERVLFGLPFVALPVLRHAHLGVRPFDLSVMLLPLVLYLFVKGQRTPLPSVRATLVVSLVGLLLYHPLTALFVIGVFSIYLAARYAPRIREQYATPTNVFSLSVALFVAWYLQFTGIILRFDRIYNTLLGQNEDVTYLEKYTGVVEEASPALIDLLRVMTFKYGLEVLLFGLGFAFLGLSLLFVIRKEYYMDSHTIMLLGTLGLFSISGILFLVMDLIVPPERPFQIAKIAATVLAGQLFYLLWYHVDWSRHRSGLQTGFHVSLTVTILLLVVLSTFGLHNSPLASENNDQVTEMELEGSRWLTEHGRHADEFSQFGISYRRFHDALYGIHAPQPLVGTGLPDHFNYTVNRHLGQSYTNDTYLTITRLGRIVYPEGFPDYRSKWRFTPADFERLERDETTARIYDNGDYNQYLVDGIADRDSST